MSRTAQTARVLDSVIEAQAEADRRVTAAWIAVDRLTVLPDADLVRHWRSLTEIREKLEQIDAALTARAAARLGAIVEQIGGGK